MFGKAISDNFNQGYENERMRQHHIDRRASRLNDDGTICEDDSLEEENDDNGPKRAQTPKERRRQRMKKDKTLIKEKALKQTDVGRQTLATKYEHLPPGNKRMFLHFCNECRLIASSNWFNTFIFGCIILAGALVGVQTYEGMEDNLTVIILDNIILYAFTLEIVLKMLSEGVSPFYFFICYEWKWNVFDFIVVLFCMFELLFCEKEEIEMC